jgi:hypothetical protein
MIWKNEEEKKVHTALKKEFPLIASTHVKKSNKIYQIFNSCSILHTFFSPYSCWSVTYSNVHWKFWEGERERDGGGKIFTSIKSWGNESIAREWQIWKHWNALLANNFLYFFIFESRSSAYEKNGCHNFHRIILFLKLKFL